ALAARVGDLAAVESMLVAGARLDARDAEGQSALQVAAAHGQTAVLRALLAAGADPAVDAAGASPLLAAAEEGQLETAALLVAHGGVSAAEKSEALQYANRNASPELARLLLRAGADAAGTLGQGPAPLAQALQYGSEALVDVYIEEGYALDVAAAARQGRVEVLGELLERGGDPRQASADGRTPLQFAIENDRPEALRVLLDHGVAADAALPTWDRRTPLHVAAAGADPEVLGVLLERGADPNQLDRVGRSPLYDAVTHGREPAVRALLEGGADPNLAPAGEALLEITRSASMRALLARYGARVPDDAPAE
ncbi:MAG: ankyrin repeat domain-containing protein, partial [Myxococcota bacterium]